MSKAVIRVGTSAFTAAGWSATADLRPAAADKPGSFYPENLKPADYLTYYATQFDTVEVDSTFYRTPGATTVRGGSIDLHVGARRCRIGAVCARRDGGRGVGVAGLGSGATNAEAAPELLQFGVFGFRIPQDGNVGVGVFP